MKSVFSATLFKSFTVYEFHQQSMLNAFLFHFKELFTTHGKDGFYGFCGAMELQVHTFSYIFCFRFRQISQRHETSVEFKFHLEHYRNFFFKRSFVKRHEKDNHFLHFITKFAPKW